MDGVTTDIGWKQFTIRVIEALRWPAAAVAIAIILREPLTRLLNGLTTAIG